MKTCVVCSETKTLDEMAKDRKYRDGVRNTCKKCHNARVKQYYIDNPKAYEHNKRIDRKRRPNWKRHNITKEQFDGLGNTCSICGIEDGLIIDHDHSCCVGAFSCGKCVRGLLCKQCNWMLGNAKDSTFILKNAVKYLESRSTLGEVALS